MIKTLFKIAKAMLVLALFGGVLNLWAGINDKSGEEVTDPSLLQTKDFWQNTMQWGDAVGDNEGDAIWYMKEGTGFPVQREDQKNFASSGDDFIIGEDKTFSNETQFLDIFEADQPLIGEEGKIDFGSYDMTLDGDIDLDGATIKSISEFDGILEGNGYKICNFTIEGKGFIEELAGTVQNLVIENAEVIYGGDTAAILAADVETSANIQNCLIKDCHLSGGRYLGMFAGDMGTAVIEKCLVVNGTITSNIGSDPDALISDAYVGGIVGKIGNGCICKYCVSMLDMFRVNYKPTKEGKLGRIFGYKTGSTSYNYGWLETGFEHWDAERQTYWRKFYPSWSTTNNSTGTGEYYNSQKNGESIFVGDVTSQSGTTYNKKADETFWDANAKFIPNDGVGDNWVYNSAEDQYPVPICSGSSSVDAAGLISRRGGEVDMTYDIDAPTRNIHTNLGFSNLHANSGSGNQSKTSIKSGTTVNFYADFELCSNSTANAIIWGLSINGSMAFPGSGFVVGYMYGTLNGNGHEFLGIANTSQINIGGTEMGFVRKIGNGGCLERLSISDIYVANHWTVSENSSSALYAGVAAGYVASGGKLQNCYVDIDHFGSNEYRNKYFYYSGLAGRVQGVCTVTKNVLKFHEINGKTFTNYTSAGYVYVGGLFGYFYPSNGSDVSKNFIGAKATNSKISAYSNESRGYVGPIVGRNQSSYGVSDNFVHKNGATNFTYRKADYGGSSNTTYQNLVSDLTPALWSNDMELDENIWDIPTEDGEYPTLKKVWFDWDAN